MKNSLKRLTIPEEQDQAFKKRRKAQENGEWQWGTPWQRKDYWRGAVCWENPEQMAQLSMRLLTLLVRRSSLVLMLVPPL